MSARSHLDWDADTYHEVSDPQREWGAGVLERLELRGDEVVLDAGCGSGAVTAELARRLPRGRIVAVDGSADMLALARERLADLGDRARFVRADLLELELDEQVDLVLSTAVFHWIPDHDRLFGRLAAVMRPGAVLEAQCGGHGNIAGVVRAIEAVSLQDPFAGPLGGFRRRWRFATPEATEARLARAGLVEVRAWLHPEPVRLPTGGPAERFLTTCVLRLHLQHLPADLHAPFAQAIAERLADEDGVALLDYVRLNMHARTPG